MEYDKNEQAKELIRLFSGVEDKRDVYKIFSGILKYIAISEAGKEEVVLPEIGTLKIRYVEGKAYLSIYPFKEFEDYLLKCKASLDNEDYCSSPLYKELKNEFNMILKSKV